MQKSLHNTLILFDKKNLYIYNSLHKERSLMAANSSGQVSYLILNSLSDGSKYGLEIIESISQKTGGNYILKKPTLYSSLTRMEKKGLISSSFWGESELGGKRHYYSITNEGRKSLELLAKEFENVSFDDEPNQTQTTINTNSSPSTTTLPDNKPVFLKQNNLFDLVKSEPAKEENKPLATDNEQVLENQMDIFSMPTQTPKQEDSTLVQKTLDNSIAQTPAMQDDGKFLENDERFTLTPSQEAQNQRLYDTSAELKKYRKKKSFSENQIEMSVVYEKQEDIEIQKSRIEELKKSILNLKNHTTPQPIESLSVSKPSASNNQLTEQKQETAASLPAPPAEEEKKDDGVFVTARMDASEIPIQKKIGPTNIAVNIYDDNLPAPKRNSNLEPTYKDMIARLFERKKEKEIQKVEEQPATQQPQQKKVETVKNVERFADYASLKKYYDNQGINFKEYNKTTVKKQHNTNFLKFISACTMFLLSAICSGALFAIIYSLDKLNPATNFMFYTVPSVFFVYGVFELIRYKVCISKKAVLTYNSIVNWAVFILGALVVFVVNITCGMQYETIPEYLTTLLVPISGILIAFPINYYFKKLLYKKFAK